MSINSDRRRLLGAVPLLLLAGCGGGRRLGLLSPRISLAGLESEVGGWLARVRMQNVTDKIMTVERIELALVSGGQQLALNLGAQKILLPPYATDVVNVPAQRQASLAEHLSQTSSRPGGAAYRLHGHLHTIDPVRRFEVEFEGFLSPVPGREGSFR
jgi:hypothetical protein